MILLHKILENRNSIYSKRKQISDTVVSGSYQKWPRGRPASHVYAHAPKWDGGAHQNKHNQHSIPHAVYGLCASSTELFFFF